MAEEKKPNSGILHGADIANIISEDLNLPWIKRKAGITSGFEIYASNGPGSDDNITTKTPALNKVNFLSRILGFIQQKPVLKELPTEKVEKFDVDPKLAVDIEIYKSGDIQIYTPDTPLQERINEALERRDIPFIRRTTCTTAIKSDYLAKLSFRQEDIENGLKYKVISALSDLSVTNIDNEVKRIEHYFLDYPSRLLAQINREKMSQNDKKTRRRRLEDILKTRDKSTTLPNEWGGSQTEYVFQIIKNADWKDYRLVVFNPKNDSRDKISELAEDVGICWGNELKSSFAENAAKDCLENGGTIILGVYKGEDPVCFIRNFVCLNGNRTPYLFLDLMEGQDYNHELEKWVKTDPGGFKLGLSASIWLAKRIGIKFVAAGDSGIADVFRCLGASKKKTAVNIGGFEMNYKIGYPAEHYLEEKAFNVVKSYFFGDCENYVIEV